MVNFPIWIPDCDSHSPGLLDIFLSSDASICSTMAFLQLGNSDHVAISVSIDFPLTFQLESDLQDTVDWGRKWLVDFNAGKTQQVSFDRSNNTGAIDVKMDGSVFEEK